MLALQNLLHEIAVSEGHPPPPPLPNAYHNAQQPHPQRVHSQSGAGPHRGSAVFNHLLSNLSGLGGAPGAAVGSGHHAASLSRASSASLAGLAISSQASTAVASSRKQRTQSPPSSDYTAAHAQSGTTAYDGTPKSAGGRVGYAQGLADAKDHGGAGHRPSHHNLPSEHKSLISNANNLHHLNVHQNTPSYFSPMVSGLHPPPDSARSAADYDHRQHHAARGDASGGIAAAGAATPAARATSVVSRGAWNSEAGTGKRSAAYGTGTAMDKATGGAAMGVSSPSKQTFNLLTASFTAGEQVPEESLQLSASLPSSQDFGRAPHSPQQARGRGRGVSSPKTGVSFSLELPEHAYGEDHVSRFSARGAQVRGVDSTPPRGRADATPGTPGSAALSEYSYMHDEDAHPGAAYISSPGRSAGNHSLSRSLSASFGQVSGTLPSDTAEAKEARRGSASPGRPAAEGKGSSPASPSKGNRYPYELSPRSPKSPMGRGGSVSVAAAAGVPAAGGSGRSGALNPALAQQFARAAAAERDSDDSVEGLEIPYGQSPSARSPGSASIRGFRIHGTAKAAQIAQQAAVAVAEAMAAVEKRFRSGACSVGPFMTSALAADVRNFDKVSTLIFVRSYFLSQGALSS
jgi:hypothetical protein